MVSDQDKRAKLFAGTYPEPGGLRCSPGLKPGRSQLRQLTLLPNYLAFPLEFRALAPEPPAFRSGENA